MPAPPLPTTLVIKHGEDFSWGFQWKTATKDGNGNVLTDDTGLPLGTPKNLSAYATVSARMQIRESADAAAVLVDLSSAFTVTKATGTFSLFVDRAVVDTWIWDRGVTDVFAVLDGADVNLVGETPVRLVPAVTR